MVINVQYNGGLLPDIILLTLCDYIGEPFEYNEEFLSLKSISPPKSFDKFSTEGGYSEGLDASIFFFEHDDYCTVTANSAMSMG